MTKERIDVSKLRKVAFTKTRGVIQISPLLAAQITALHKDCGSKEWSGVLFFRPIVEDLRTPENFRAVAEAVYPMDYGNSAYTEYEFEADDLIEMYDRYPKASPEKGLWKSGHIHTHHNMSTFFSGTDMSELEDNVEKYPYYLSLIVNFDGKYTAKVAYLAETQNKLKYRVGGNNGGKKTVALEPETVMVTFDLDVKIMLDQWFIDRLDKIDSKPVSFPSYSSVVSYGRGTQHDKKTPQQNQYSKTHNWSRKDDEDDDKTVKISLADMTRLKQKIKDNMGKLLFKDDKDQNDSKFYMMIARVKELYPSEEQQKGYIGWVSNRAKQWLETTLAEEIKEYPDMIYTLALEAGDLVHCYEYNDKFALALKAAVLNRFRAIYRNRAETNKEIKEVVPTMQVTKPQQPGETNNVTGEPDNKDDGSSGYGQLEMEMNGYRD